MLFLIITIAVAVICVVSLIVGPRLNTDTIGFKVCVAVSAISLIATIGLGIFTYLTFNMGDISQIEQHEVDDTFDLWLPAEGPLTINSMQDEKGTWVYEIHTFDPATGEEQMRYSPADLTSFLDPAEDGRCYMEWTESYVTYGDLTFHDAATMDFGVRNEDEMEAVAANMIAKPNCVVYVPRGTIVNHPPEGAVPAAEQPADQPAEGEQPAEPAPEEAPAGEEPPQ